MSFQEFTLSNGDCEVMADIDTNTGKIIDLYCYADNIPFIENEETGREYKITTKSGKNPSFVHIARPGAIFKLLLINGFIAAGIDDTEPDYEDNVKTFKKAMGKYNLPLSTNLY